MKNGKFEVGDKIRVKHFDERPAGWNREREMDYLMSTARTVTRVDYGSEPYGVCVEGKLGIKREWFLRLGEFELYTPEQSIHITSDGNTVHAVLKDDKEVLKRTKAQCAPTDTFDFKVGAELAMSRLWETEKEDKSKDIKVGDSVRIQQGNAPLFRLAIGDIGIVTSVKKAGCDVEVNGTLEFMTWSQVEKVDAEKKQDFKVGDYVRAKKTPDNPHNYTDQNMELGVVTKIVSKEHIHIAVIRHPDKEKLNRSIGRDYIAGKDLFEVVPMPRPEVGEWVEIIEGCYVGVRAEIKKDDAVFWKDEHFVKLIPPQEPIKKTKTVFCKFKYIENQGVERYKTNHEWVDACHGQEVVDGSVKGTTGKTYTLYPDWTKEVEI